MGLAPNQSRPSAIGMKTRSQFKLIGHSGGSIDASVVGPGRGRRSNRDFKASFRSVPAGGPGISSCARIQCAAGASSDRPRTTSTRCPAAWAPSIKPRTAALSRGTERASRAAGKTDPKRDAVSGHVDDA